MLTKAMEIDKSPKGAQQWTFIDKSTGIPLWSSWPLGEAGGKALGSKTL